MVVIVLGTELTVHHMMSLHVALMFLNDVPKTIQIVLHSMETKVDVLGNLVALLLLLTLAHLKWTNRAVLVLVVFGTE